MVTRNPEVVDGDVGVVVLDIDDRTPNVTLVVVSEVVTQLRCVGTLPINFPNATSEHLPAGVAALLFPLPHVRGKPELSCQQCSLLCQVRRYQGQAATPIILTPMAVRIEKALQ